MSKPDPKMLAPVIGLDLIPLHRHDFVDDKGVKRGKSPRDKNWRDRTYSADEVRKHMASGGNVGVRLAPHHLVVDVDPRNFPEGDDVERRFLEAFGVTLDDFPWTATPSGGKHVFMTKPEDVDVATALEGYKGIEIKTVGTQVVAPGSLHPDKPGHYEAHDTFFSEYGAPPPAPKALIEAARRRKPERRDASAGAHTTEQLALMLDALPVEEFDSNDKWFPILCASHHATDGDGVEEFVEWSTSDQNYAGAEHDIRTRWHSLDARKEGGVKVETLYKELHARKRGDVVELVTRARPEDEFEAVSPEDVLRFAVQQEKPTQRRRFVEYGLDDLAKVEAPRWLVDRLIPENGLALVYGRPKAGKTFWAFALSLSIATGRDFCGLKTLPGRVSYIAAEGGPARLRDRARAWLKANGIDQSEAKDFGLFAERIDISDHKEVEKLIEALGPEPRRLVVVDTLARSMSGDENTQQDMGRLIAGCDRIRQATGATVLLVHHEGKDPSSGARGSSALVGAIDTGLRLQSTSRGRIELDVKEQRDGENTPTMHFMLTNVPLSGIEDSSAALVHVPAAKASKREQALEAAIEVGDGAPQKRLVEEIVARALEKSQSAAERLAREALGNCRENARLYDGFSLWLEPVSAANPNGGKVLRVEPA